MSNKHNLTQDDFDTKIKYINLKNHSGYSLLLGLGGSKKHIKETFKKGHQGVAFTDNGVMMGCLDLYNQARDKKLLEGMGYKGKKYPIIMGTSLYITPNTNIKDQDNKYSGITILVKNQLSYENLCLLTSIASLEEKFYMKPRIDYHDLAENNAELIVLSGGFNGFLSTAIHENHGVLKKLILRFIQDQDLCDSLYNHILRIATYPDRGYELLNQISKMTPKVELSELEIQVLSSWLGHKDNFLLFGRILKATDMQRLLKSYEKKFPVEKEVYQSILQTNIFDQLSDDDKLAYINLLNDYYPETYVEWFKNMFGDNFYIELNPNDMSMQWVREEKRHVHTGSNPQDKVNRKLVELSKTYNVKIILVQDSYIPDKDQHIIQSIQIMNSPGGKDGWYFYEAPEIMDIATMYEKTITNYDWITDDQFIEWCNHSYEVLEKCKDCELEFQPSLPIIKYEDHYVNKVPTVIKRSLILALQELGKWDEDVKDRIIKNKNIKEEPVPDWLKEKFNTDEKCIDFDDMEKRVKENVFLEETLVKMKTHFKKEKDFLRLIIRSEKDLAMRTALKVMMRYQKLLPKTVDEDRLNAEIEKRTPGKKQSDFKKEAIDKFIMKMNLYKVSKDPMLLLGDKITRDRLLEECNTIQYNGILRLIGYFMLLEDVTNFVNENNYLRGFGRGCLGENTLVLIRHHGWKKITSVQPGDYVWTHESRWKKVIKTFAYELENEKCVKVSFNNITKPLILTTDHKVFSPEILGNDFIEIRKLNVSNRIINSYPKKGSPVIFKSPTKPIITKIEPIQCDFVFDLLIEDDASFLTHAGIVHNSGAGSIVAYALDITDCQPIENGLLFERFLTTERIGEKEYELEGFSLKEFLQKKNQSRIEISQEDLIISDDDLDDMGEELIEDGE